MSWIDQFPGLSRLPDAIRSYLVEESKIVTVPANTVIFGPGKSPENLLLLLDGTVRVQQTSDT
ncbi:MAG: Crp/Fnr family transcriptional regulator, partial [Rhodospirillales bacterium]|nr:Crp/Fnr family transcriptional regulator [Rhodospirillales bacterium]